MLNNVHITAAGTFLPKDPVPNGAMADYIGRIDDQSERIGRLILRQNRIKTRHYALNPDGDALYSGAQMSARAGAAALDAAALSGRELEFLATSTTQGDLLVPGHASAVHAALSEHVPNLGALDIASFQSVCASSMMAAQMAALKVETGLSNTALITGSEFSSRWFRPGFYPPGTLEDKNTRMAAEFLRWTLSDGAGALVMQNTPGRAGGFKVKWIKTVSLAHHFDVCMHAGAANPDRHDLTQSWSHHSRGPAGAAADGAIMLLQDMELLKRIIRAWVGEYLKLVDSGLITPNDVDWLLCHYSAHSLREEIIRIMQSTGGMIDEEKWFTNLPTKGNTGAASLFIMIDEFMQKSLAKPGDSVLCIVPESGRAMVSFMMLESL